MLTELLDALLFSLGATLPYMVLFYAMAERPRRGR